MNSSLTFLDLIVAAIYLLLSVAIGMWMGRNNRNIDDYLLGGRNMSWWAILGSIVSTETSAATFLSVPGLAYAQGGNFSFLQLAFGYILGRIVVTMFLLPLYFRGELLTAYQILQTRFGISTRRIASGTFLVTRNLGDGLRMFLTGLTLHHVTGWSMTVCILIAGGVTILYTLYGGLRSVVWSDCIQFVIYMIAAAVTLWILIDRIPGNWAGLMEFGRENQKFVLFDWSWDWSKPFTFWAGIVGGMFITLGSHGTDQMMVQRCLAAPNCRDAGKAMIASGLIVFFQFAVFLLIGTALAAFFHSHPPAAALSKDESYLAFIMQELPSGLRGLTLAGIFAAAFTGSLNACASTLIGDFGSLFRVDRLSESQRVTLSRAATFVFGIVQMIVALIAAALASDSSLVENVLAVAGLSAGVLLGVFILGQLPLRVTEPGAIAGMATALIVVFGVCIETKMPHLIGFEKSPFPIAYPWWPVIGSALTVFVGIAASYVSQRATTAAAAEESVA
ncbi:Sodium/glucose cotransporter [Caulifigura coniformis]|uniref:Sodium/glucose cotransporter n=1 Tax=Caulifigura coniformis TaxID=2527983 RepID=A0A517SH74_9PLAN|nr:sodium:solute symporter [Caulifigura coniformis]QDT55470.1 Sodium/glucose cotransporter [Caulifigura coniformis]